MSGLTDPDAGITDLKADHRVLFGLGFELSAQNHFAALRELNRIAEKIRNHLPQPAGIAAQGRRHVAIDQARQFNLLLVNTFSQQFNRVLDGVVQEKVERFEM